MGGGEGWTVRCFVPLMHFCIGKYQSVPRLLAMIVAMLQKKRSGLKKVSLIYLVKSKADVSTEESEIHNSRLGI